MTGSTVSHYRILEKLGQGGMGVVYKAVDERLNRTVALKFLQTDAFDDGAHKARFVREAQAAAALDHPSICTVHEIDEVDGQLFIGMAYVEGASLRSRIESGPFAVDEAVKVAIKVAKGLQAAHAHNILHCDVSPSNILVTGEGRVKITDFGLARIVGTCECDHEGRAVGTMAYMSPEQVRGETVDLRTDIWSLGVCLYQMLTGKLPFTGDYAPAVFYAITSEDPVPVRELRPEVPTTVADVVQKAMSKAPSDRHETAGELIGELKAALAMIEAGGDIEAPVAFEHAIAVLPFANLSADPEQEFFCDGITEDILNLLTRVEGLRVVARTSAFAFRGRTEDVREIGRSLNVDVVLEGSVRKWDNTLRVTAQLINVADGYHIWSERYDRELADVFAIQDEISEAIVRELEIKLIGRRGKTPPKRYTDNVEAYTYYLKGRFYWNKRNECGLLKGIQCFERAIQADPTYAIAYAGLADSYNLIGFYSMRPPREVFRKAKLAASRALEIDENLAEAYCSLGFAKMFHDWDWEGAGQDFKRALDLDPRYPTANHWYAEYLVLLGRHEEAVTQSEVALASDPLSLIINTLLGWIHYFEGNHAEAIEQYGRTLEMDSRFVPAHFFLGLALIHSGRFDEAIAEFERASDLFGASHLFSAAMGYAYAMAGRKADAEATLRLLRKAMGTEHVPLYFVAAIHLGLGNVDSAIRWLVRAYEQNDSWLSFLKVDPIWEVSRCDPRLQSLLVRVGQGPNC